MNYKHKINKSLVQKLNSIENYLDDNTDIDTLLKIKSKVSDPKIKEIKKVTSTNMKSLLKKGFTLS